MVYMKFLLLWLIIVLSLETYATSFQHGVASGDPLANQVIIWTRVTPDIYQEDITVNWQIALDENFKYIIQEDNASTNLSKDFTIKIDVKNLQKNTQYFYRFKTNTATSPIGKTKTLPQGDISQVKFMVFSCANYSAGYFHVYKEAAQQKDIDVAIHLGDYIYEHEYNGYASEDAEKMGRIAEPLHELLILEDYRKRYAQYREDPDLQALHQNIPMIAIWDDHEIANNAYQQGAENHNKNEGDYEIRKQAALQAYYEWLPIRVQDKNNLSKAYRYFQFGNLVDLYILETRLAREKQLTHKDLFALQKRQPTLLGQEQLTWLLNNINKNQGVWQVLGQQVLMAKMHLPAAVLLPSPQKPYISAENYWKLLQLKAKTELTKAENKFFNKNKIYLRMPNVPYNLDAWDGYSLEREKVLQAFVNNHKNLIVLAGDSHNAWANNIKTQDQQAAGVEFATTSVSSPGLETFLQLADEEVPIMEQALVTLLDNLHYTNASQRGYLTVTFTKEKAIAHFQFVNTVKEKDYHLTREKTLEVLVNKNYIK